ncbi:TDP-N-acetylfucosamine:lipid II N-acetylfucosaminyltransferase [uncultured Victivallis sp.]|uniref:TDP-N-acetylfucosamine:lipid II N-acetylfucosaminyltransferase n=1 Tax=uncultured Victivallis sp. TaxID=354118 RepID=UPI0026009081|nr:TDP-N-acetylfucosamine:lipid II N-acetylfucosaminyltransferase [uncultured Victivallis sp.]
MLNLLSAWALLPTLTPISEESFEWLIVLLLILIVLMLLLVLLAGAFLCLGVLGGALLMIGGVRERVVAKLKKVLSHFPRTKAFLKKLLGRPAAPPAVSRPAAKASLNLSKSNAAQSDAPGMTRDLSQGLYFNYQQVFDITSYKYVHIMNNGIHSVGIINFICSNFDTSEHCFIFPYIMYPKTQFALRRRKNVFFGNLINMPLKTLNKIIIHGLFDQRLVNFFYVKREYLAKTYWFIWGGDLYNSPKDEKNTFVKNNVHAIITAFDRQEYEKRFKPGKKCCYATYPHEIHSRMLKRTRKDDYLLVQINNSADTLTLEMLRTLGKFRNEKMIVTTILSYHSDGQKDLLSSICRTGYSIFGEKFQPIFNFMPKRLYARHLANVDIYISNQRRQQGNGSAVIIASLGRKVYLSPANPVYHHYNQQGIKIFNSNDIAHMSFEEFRRYDSEQLLPGVEKLRHRMMDSTKVKQWQQVFKDVC